MIRAVGFILISFLGMAQMYENTSLTQLGEDSSGTIKLVGYFETDKTFSSRIDGTLRLGSDVLPVRGGAFDWLPQDKSWIVVWGELRSEEGKPYLEFHNGHPLREPKVPRPVPDALLSDVQGKRTEVWLKVSISGAQPNSFYQGISENRKSFVLDGYKGDLGIQCLSGVGVKVQNRRALTNICACAPGETP